MWVIKMQENFLYELTHDDIYFKYAKGPSSRSGKEFHPFFEIILFLGGDAELISETVNTRLAPDTVVFIPKETYHQVLIGKDKDNYRRCVINFTDKILPASRDRLNALAIFEFNEKLRYLFDTAVSVSKDATQANASLLRSVLEVILYELSSAEPKASSQNSLSGVTATALRYIEENILKELNVETVAKACHMSPSSLSHSFKKDMQTSVYRYCLQKKLLCAYDRISHGTPATVAALECGFTDYSGFYKQYKKMFGFSPSKK